MSTLTLKQEIDLLVKFIEFINKADIECINSYLSDDHIYIDLSGNIRKGKEEVNWKGYYELFPDYEINVDQIYERDEKLIIVGTSVGNFSENRLKVFTTNGEKPKKENFQGKAI